MECGVSQRPRVVVVQRRTSSSLYCDSCRASPTARLRHRCASALNRSASLSSFCSPATWMATSTEPGAAETAAAAVVVVVRCGVYMAAADAASGVVGTDAASGAARLAVSVSLQ